MKGMLFISVPIRNLSRRPLRTFLTVLGIGVAVAGFVVLVSLSRGIENAWIRSLETRGVHMLAMSKESVELLTATLDEKLAGKIAAQPGVADVSGELVNVVRVEEGVHVVMRGWPDDSFLWDTIVVEKGTLPDQNNKEGIVIGQTLARVLKADIGDPLEFMGKEFNISAISASAGVMNDSAVIMRLETLQNLLGRSGNVTVFSVRLKNGGDAGAARETAKRLESVFNGLAFVPTKDIGENNDIIEVLRVTAWSVSFVAMITALVVVLNTLLMSVTERTKEIGVLSAIGWAPSRILTMILFEGIVLSLAGSSIGAVLGVFAAKTFASMPKLRSLCEVIVDNRLLVETAAVTVALGLLGSLYPALRAVGMRPIEALKHE